MILRNTCARRLEYFITDQQGNTRVSFEDNNGTVALIQENSYYAFGMQMAGGYTPGTNPNKKLYNAGSEWQDDIDGLADYYSTFFREYDPIIGRFNGVDPVSESFESWTTYHYSYNNPVNFNDPMGNVAKTDRGKFIEELLRTIREEGIESFEVSFSIGFSGEDAEGKGGSINVSIIEFDEKSNEVLFLTADAAAAMWSLRWGPISQAKEGRREHSAMIYSKKRGEKTLFGATQGVKWPEGGAGQRDPELASPGPFDPMHGKLPDGATWVAHIHTHLNNQAEYWDGNYGNENFSKGDKENYFNDKYNIDFYLVSPTGSLRVFRNENGVNYPLGITRNGKFYLHFNQQPNGKWEIDYRMYWQKPIDFTPQ